VYKFKSNSPNEAIIKYKDDEGDFISISSTAELQEAFSITRTQVPPILRLFLASSSSQPIPQYTPEGNVETEIVHEVPQPEQSKVEEIKQIKPEIKEEKEEIKEEKKVEEKAKEYPYLKISDWDAPQKVVVTETKTVSVPVLIVDSIKPKTIAQSTNDESVEISRSVQSFSLSTTAQTHQSSATVLELMNLHCTSFNGDLSKEISDSCKDLSRKTSELCEEMTRMTRAESVTGSDQSVVDVASFSKETVRMCEQFSKETAEMLAQQARDTDKNLGLLKEQSNKLSELSRTTVEMGNSLSRDTSASGAEASAFILQTIMGL